MRGVRRPGDCAVARIAAIAAIAIVIAGCGEGQPLPTLSTPGHAPAAPPNPFAPTSLWNAPLPADAPLDATSATVVSELAATAHSEVERGVGPWINTSENSIPVYRVAATAPTVRVQLNNAGAQEPAKSGAPVGESALQQVFDAVPIPAGAQPAAGTDHTMVVYQPSRDRLWEFWLMHLDGGTWHAQWGGEMNGVANGPGFFHGPGPSRGWGASASGLAVLGGLITPQELTSGVIDHALALAVPDVRAGEFAAPAQRTDGRVRPPGGIPEGSHLRLDPTLDVAALNLPPVANAIALAAQRYGIVVRDYAGNIAFYAEDPLTLGSDPYPVLFGSQSPSALLASFPWNRLQLLRARLST